MELLLNSIAKAGDKFVFFVAVFSAWIIISSCATSPDLKQTVDQSGEITMKDLENAARSLDSPDFRQSTESVEILFKGGGSSIPFLLDQYDNEIEFSGYCGFGSIQAAYIEETDEESSKRFQIATVREVALYLTVAILKSKLYFAWKCYPVIDKTPETEVISCVLDQIRVLYSTCVKQGIPFTLAEVERILEEHGVRYNLSTNPRQDMEE